MNPMVPGFYATTVKKPFGCRQDLVILSSALTWAAGAWYRNCMSQPFQAVFEHGVLRPLEPLDLPENQLVSISIVNEAAVPQTVEALQKMSAEEKQAVLALLDKMEQMPQKSPADDFSQRDHDRVIYGLTK